MKKKTEFNLRFKDNYGEGHDFCMTLHTVEPTTSKDVENLIDIYDDVIRDSGYEEYTPYDIMDRICEAKGWDYIILDPNEVVVYEWG